MSCSREMAYYGGKIRPGRLGESQQGRAQLSCTPDNALRLAQEARLTRLIL